LSTRTIPIYTVKDLPENWRRLSPLNSSAAVLVVAIAVLLSAGGAIVALSPWWPITDAAGLVADRRPARLRRLTRISESNRRIAWPSTVSVLRCCSPSWNLQTKRNR